MKHVDTVEIMVRRPNHALASNRFLMFPLLLLLVVVVVVDVGVGVVVVVVVLFCANFFLF